MCSECWNHLLYPIWATSACCAVCNAFTYVPPPPGIKLSVLMASKLFILQNVCFLTWIFNVLGTKMAQYGLWRLLYITHHCSCTSMVQQVHGVLTPTFYSDMLNFSISLFFHGFKEKKTEDGTKMVFLAGLGWFGEEQGEWSVCICVLVYVYMRERERERERKGETERGWV